MGTGFFVDSAGRVLTNSHVILDCAQVVMLYEKRSRVTRVLAMDTRSDLALLDTGVRPTRHAVFRSTPAVLGEAAYAVGYPLLDILRSLNVTNGIVSGLAGPEADERVLQTTAPVQPGNSGGPLIDGGGRVIGVVVARLDIEEAQNVNYAIKTDLVFPFAGGFGLDVQPPGRSLAPERIARDAGAFTVPLVCLK
jgi:S1-C subfamily serine protease